MSQENRVETMAVKLSAYARRAGVPHEELLTAYARAVELRVRVLPNVYHPDLLHPARTALILLEDAGVRDHTLLSAAALTETEFAEMRIPDDVLRVQFGGRVAELVQAVPQPAQVGDKLLEELLAVPDDVALMAVAERLDHARHLHFRERTFWQPFYQQVLDVYLPFAERINQPVGLRFSRWCGAFQRRLTLSA